MTGNSAELFELVFEQCADGMLVSNAEGIIERCNPAFARLLAKPEADFAGRPLSEYIDLASEQSTPDKNGSQSESEDESRNATVFMASGLRLVMPVSQMQAGKGETKRTLTVVYIVQSHSVQQAQTEFVSTVSHEFRTPLTSIKGFADTILRAGNRLDASAQRRYIGIIKDQADRLTRLVEDLLAVSRLESRRMQLTIRAINLEEAIERVLQNLSEKAKGHKIDIKVPQGLPPVWADADRLEQILTNLIDNAIKYSPSGTTVKIAARELLQETELVEFSVTDQGGGIATESLPEIFNKFSRLDNPLTRQTEGTGLGLYITKSLVLALDGKISVSSQPGTTTFTVQIPAATLEQQAARGRGVSTC